MWSQASKGKVPAPKPCLTVEQLIEQLAGLVEQDPTAAKLPVMLRIDNFAHEFGWQWVLKSLTVVEATTENSKHVTLAST